MCVHVCEPGTEMGRKGGQTERWAERQRGRVTVNAQLSHLTGLSCWSASVCKI